MPLPCRKVVRLESALDYIGQDTMKVCGFLPNTRLRVHLAELVVTGICRARKEDITMDAVMVLRRDLTGTFTARFTPQDGTGRAEASVTFGGGQVLNQGGMEMVLWRLKLVPSVSLKDVSRIEF